MSVGERRRHPRVAVDVPVRLLTGGQEHLARLCDICRDAVLVEAPAQWPVDTELRLSMELPGVSGAIDVAGRVIRLAPAEGGRHSMAILFANMSPTVAMRIDFLVALQSDLNGSGGGPLSD
jgi:hypothetical protein